MIGRKRDREMINRRMEICSLVIYVYDRQAVHLVSLDFPLFTKDREERLIKILPE